MRPTATHRTVTLAVTLAIIAGPTAASAAPGDARVDRIVGQPDGASSMPDVGAKGLYYPAGLAYDGAGNLFVADMHNHRVLGYRSPMTTDTVADLVIGQPDFNSNAANNGGVSNVSLNYPSGVAVSAAGDLYVADYSNNRVLQYDRPFDTDRVADRVFGQPDFSSSAVNLGHDTPLAGSLWGPWAVAVDSAGPFTRLWVSDTINNRVLAYDNPTGTRGRPADFVLGQDTFVTRDFGTGRTAMFAPTGLAVDAVHRVWVADQRNSRVLRFDDPTAHGDKEADLVIGQPDFVSNFMNYEGSVSAAGLAEPFGLCVDLNNNLWVVDQGNNRVLMYTAALVTGDRIADRVFGQPDFTSNADNSMDVSADGLNLPVGVAIDPSGNVAVSDYGNSRVVLLQTPTPIVTSIAVKVSPATGKRKLIVRGFGMVAGSAVVEVDGTALQTTKYKELATDGSARRLVALDPNFDALVPPQVQVSVTIVNPLTGSRSAPILYPMN